jgi:hypothetical protein
MLDINPKLSIKIYYVSNNLSDDENSDEYTKIIKFPLMSEFNYNDELLLTNEKFHYFYTPPPDTSDENNTKYYEIINFEIYSN